MNYPRESKPNAVSHATSCLRLCVANRQASSCGYRYIKMNKMNKRREDGCSEPGDVGVYGKENFARSRKYFIFPGRGDASLYKYVWDVFSCTISNHSIKKYYDEFSVRWLRTMDLDPSHARPEQSQGSCHHK